MTLHIVGDSHSLCFDGAKDVVPHWLGALTAFNLWKKNKLLTDLIKSIPAYDTVWFCFGEIDCRVHIYPKSIEYGINTYFLLEESAAVYHHYVDELASRANRDITCMFVPPQGDEPNTFNIELYPTRETRQDLTNKFNQELMYKAWSFVDIWKGSIELWPMTNFKPDMAHIKNEIAIKYLEEYIEANNVG